MKVLRKAVELEIEKTVDVLVVGGGPAGVGAAVSAARNGAKTLLLEKRAFLGGNITACFVENCNYFLKGTPFHSEGIYAEIERRCKEEFGSDNIRLRNPNAFCSHSSVRSRRSVWVVERRISSRALVWAFSRKAARSPRLRWSRRKKFSSPNRASQRPTHLRFGSTGKSWRSIRVRT